MSQRLAVTSIGLATLALLAGAPTTASATPFEVVPGGLQLVEFESEAPVENIRGISTEARGALEVDLANPSRSKGTISVPVASLRTGNTTRDEHLRGDMWLDAAAHPDLTFTLDTLKLDLGGALIPGAVTAGRLTGTLSIKGTKRPFDIAIKVAYLAGSEALKKAYIPGNALRVKGTFNVVLADFGVKPPSHILGVKVADTVSVRFALTALEK